MLPGLRSNTLDDIDIGHGVCVAAVVTWGFDSLDPTVARAYRACVVRAMPWLTELDGEENDLVRLPAGTHESSKET